MQKDWNYHGNGRANFFEGWYLKHQQGEKTLAIIPGVQVSKNANKKSSAFIQIITENSSYYIEEPISKFVLCANGDGFAIGENFFGKTGIKLNINKPGLELKGGLKYGKFSPIRYNIMGPFSVIPFMECSHGVVSMKHSVKGEILLNNKRFNFSEGRGYIERDWGRSFPKNYIWTQCNAFNGENCSVMAATADIPIGKASFRGVICAIKYNNCEYRLATYLGAAVVHISPQKVIIKQGRYSLQVEVLERSPQPLKAPQLGNMSRTIHENAACRVKYKFEYNNKIIFNLESSQAGFEEVL